MSRSLDGPPSSPRLSTRDLALVTASFALGLGLTGWFRTRPPPPPPLPAEPAALRLRLVDGDGQGVACAATLWELVPGGRRFGPGSSLSCRDGWLAWGGLPAGSYLLNAQGPGVEFVELPVQLGADERKDLGEQRLAPAGELWGTVTRLSPEGKPQPVRGAQVLARNGRRARTANDGTFRLVGLRPGELQVWTGDGRGSDEEAVTIVAGEVARVELVIEARARGVLGVMLDANPAGLRVREVLPGSPAEGRLAEGELVVAVDGASLGGRKEREALRLLQGPPGQPVTLAVEGAGGERREVTLTRVAATALDDGG